MKELINKFNIIPDTDKKFGPIDFYSEEDIFNKKVLTTSNLTDLKLLILFY